MGATNLHVIPQLFKGMSLDSVIFRYASHPGDKKLVPNLRGGAVVV